ncbi:uncharacterized protein CDV56_104300 [Aspergillus thermomutatus]|uniref:Uncharacterized protein n=1 Tax=Aspergillus thermomutatus TaxID=41047 RepID=A0A397I215_ASPTH|nr:uncharacterized protein CDV56_104300 [Aspergillus thermomutatus]RHZ68278.1 hypothetical protein CDV56_104300 [Aspergillus thermomutatus]
MSNIFQKVKEVMSGRFNDPNETTHYDDGGKRKYNDSSTSNDFGSAVHDALPGSGNSRPNIGGDGRDRNDQYPPSAESHRGSRGTHGSNSSTENYATASNDYEGRRG